MHDSGPRSGKWSSVLEALRKSSSDWDLPLGSMFENLEFLALNFLWSSLQSQSQQPPRWRVQMQLSYALSIDSYCLAVSAPPPGCQQSTQLLLSRETSNKSDFSFQDTWYCTYSTIEAQMLFWIGFRPARRQSLILVGESVSKPKLCRAESFRPKLQLDRFLTTDEIIMSNRLPVLLWCFAGLFEQSNTYHPIIRVSSYKYSDCKLLSIPSSSDRILRGSESMCFSKCHWNGFLIVPVDMYNCRINQDLDMCPANLRLRGGGHAIFRSRDDRYNFTT